MDTTVLAKSLGLADDATEEQISEKLAEVTAQASKADDLATEVETLKKGTADEKTELEELRESLKVETTKRIEGERNTILAAAVEAGQMVPAEREALVEAFGDNVDGLKKVLDARPKNATLARERGGSGDAPDRDVETAAEAKKFENADGDELDADGLSDHAKAIQIIGKPKYTEDEYLAALSQAQRERTAVTA